MRLYIKQQGKGCPIILLHGWGFNGDIWDDMAKRLAQNWHVYQVDLPGHGRSTPCDVVMSNLTQLTQHLAQHLPKEAVWIGWSMGGLLAMAMARWHPTFVRALILVSTSPRFTTAENWPHAITPSVLQQFSQQLQTDIRGTLQRFLTLQVSNRAQLRLLKTFLKNTTLPHATALTSGLQLLQNVDLRAEVAQIQCPSLLCLGGRDTLVPNGIAQSCKDCWPQLHTVCIKPAAHVPFLSHPDIFMRILEDFLGTTHPLKKTSPIT
ncbi:MAG: pimeloyl-ACP methyl ester esterase BioH [Thiomargarita sp.]|nr:pimeloyl-ACP methyl ester esterase BioH [Thiomargarita sp.]